jgi:hypothetical protein
VITTRRQIDVDLLKEPLRACVPTSRAGWRRHSPAGGPAHEPLGRGHVHDGHAGEHAAQGLGRAHHAVLVPLLELRGAREDGDARGGGAGGGGGGGGRGEGGGGEACGAGGGVWGAGEEVQLNRHGARKSFHGSEGFVLADRGGREKRGRRVVMGGEWRGATGGPFKGVRKAIHP